jgi:protein MpaA
MAALIVLATVIGLLVATAGGDGDLGRPPRVARADDELRPVTAANRVVMTIGYSVEHRPIRVVVVGDPRAPRRMLVVGCVHGDERAGIAVAKLLASWSVPRGTALWIVPVLNPDGAATGTRQNSRGVDLNRNFPYRWRALGTRGDQQYSGVRALSEPEARAARALILRVRPQISIWFHQPLGLVDLSGGSPAIERRFARLARLAVQRLTRYPGSAVGWENARLRGTTAFVVELPPGRLSAPARARNARAVLRLLGA